VLDATRRLDVDRVVFASSGAVVAGARPPLSEILLPHPLAPYGASKLYGEAALEAFSSVYGLSGISLRFSNVYGPYCSHKGSVVAAFCRRAIRRLPLVIHGSGRQTRDFVHVRDITRALRIALRSPSGGVFHLGTGVETSINRLARLVSEGAGAQVRVERRPAKPGEARRNYVDLSRARRILRFEPRVKLEDGLADTLDWVTENDDPGSRRRIRA
jgi:UDP-glucose 4-epimerase